MCQCLWQLYYLSPDCKEDYKFTHSDVVLETFQDSAVWFQQIATKCNSTSAYTFLENAVSRFISFQLGQVVWGCLDHFWCHLHGWWTAIPHLLFLRMLACRIPSLACDFQPPCHRFSLDSASMQHDTKCNRLKTERHNFKKWQQKAQFCKTKLNVFWKHFYTRTVGLSLHSKVRSLYSYIYKHAQCLSLFSVLFLYVPF